MKNIVRWISKGRPIVTAVIVEYTIPEKENNPLTSITFEKGKTKKCNALIDTGATMSVISKKIIEELGLKPIGKEKLNSVSHNNQETNVYNIWMGLSVNEKMSFDIMGPKINSELIWFPLNVVAGEAIHDQGIDCIIGMNIIMAGHLSISGNYLMFSI